MRAFAIAILLIAATQVPVWGFNPDKRSGGATSEESTAPKSCEHMKKTKKQKWVSVLKKTERLTRGMPGRPPIPVPCTTKGCPRAEPGRR